MPVPASYIQINMLLKEQVMIMLLVSNWWLLCWFWVYIVCFQCRWFIVQRMSSLTSQIIGLLLSTLKSYNVFHIYTSSVTHFSLQIYITFHTVMWQLLDWAQQIGTSVAPTGWGLFCPEVLGEDFPTVCLQAAPLLPVSGCTQLVCHGNAQTWTR